MWQLLLTAAVAGSTGFIAKHLLSPIPPQNDAEYPPRDSILPSFESPAVSNDEEQRERIFRFSSSGSSSGSKSNIDKNKKKKIRDLRGKSGLLCRRLKYGVESDKVENGSGDSEASGRKFSAVCSKNMKKVKKIRRSTANNVPGKCASSSSKDSSLFGWGLGVGIMYMMSAGKAEICKLSTAMDETSKVVEELRTELHKRKSVQVAASSKRISGEHTQLEVNRSSAGDRNPGDVKVMGMPLNDDVECPSSVLTEEQEPEVLEMDQLEAELESELQKLPWCSTEASSDEAMRRNLSKAELLSEGLHDVHGDVPYQCHGVLPSELDQKLCHLLIEQQENQIEGLESELHLAQSKLNEKEAELQALKDCVRCLNEFSLSAVSDDEAGEHEEQEYTAECDNSNKMGSEPRKSIVGMKRSIGSA